MTKKVHKLNLLWVYGSGLLECPRCHRQWTQRDEKAHNCCGVSPAIYDDVYWEAMATMSDS